MSTTVFERKCIAVKAQMKLRVRNYARGAGSWSETPKKKISRSIVVCFVDSFSHFFNSKFH